MLAGLICLGNILCFRLSPFRENTRSDSVLENEFVGVEACRSCHKAIVDSFMHTAHYFTSRPGTAESIKGSFRSGENIFKYNQFIEVMLQQKGDSLLQTAYVSGQEIQSEKIDITVGSGRKGQSYLYWKEDELYQLPVSYFSLLNTWCNSPGFATTFPRYNRQIPGQCMECHFSGIKIKEETAERTAFEKSEILYGINCERCHGPGQAHITYHTEHKNEEKGKYIISNGSFTRQQRLDACAFCHSGFRKQIKPSFSFSAGDKLDEYSIANYDSDSSSSLDVHGNQYGLLMASKCFKNSSMNCSSCHNVHADEYNKPALFSQRCISCHQSGKNKECGFSPPPGTVLADNCIDCHMPSLPSGKIVLSLSGNKSQAPDVVRTHKVAIYDAAAKEFVSKKR